MNDKEALEKAIALDTVDTKVPEEAKDSRCFICYEKNDLVDLIKEMF